MFFPSKGSPATPAQAVCAHCLVSQECGEFALTLGDALPGVWGGLSQKRRRRLRAELREGAHPQADRIGERQDRDDLVRILTSSGLSTAEIADRLGVTQRTVSRARERNRRKDQESCTADMKTS